MSGQNRRKNQSLDFRKEENVTNTRLDETSEKSESYSDLEEPKKA